MTADITCPYCQENVPVKLKLENTMFEAYIEVEGYTWHSEPVPEISIEYRVDLEALARDIGRLVKEEKERKKRWKIRSDKTPDDTDKV